MLKKNYFLISYLFYSKMIRYGRINDFVNSNETENKTEEDNRYYNIDYSRPSSGNRWTTADISQLNKDRRTMKRLAIITIFILLLINTIIIFNFDKNLKDNRGIYNYDEKGQVSRFIELDIQKEEKFKELAKKMNSYIFFEGVYYLNFVQNEKETFFNLDTQTIKKKFENGEKCLSTLQHNDPICDKSIKEPFNDDIYIFKNIDDFWNIKADKRPERIYVYLLDSSFIYQQNISDLISNVSGVQEFYSNEGIDLANIYILFAIITIAMLGKYYSKESKKIGVNKMIGFSFKRIYSVYLLNQLILSVGCILFIYLSTYLFTVNGYKDYIQMVVKNTTIILIFQLIISSLLFVQYYHKDVNDLIKRNFNSFSTKFVNTASIILLFTILNISFNENIELIKVYNSQRESLEVVEEELKQIKTLNVKDEDLYAKKINTVTTFSPSLNTFANDKYKDYYYKTNVPYQNLPENVNYEYVIVSKGFIEENFGKELAEKLTNNTLIFNSNHRDDKVNIKKNADNIKNNVVEEINMPAVSADQTEVIEATNFTIGINEIKDTDLKKVANARAFDPSGRGSKELDLYFENTIIEKEGVYDVTFYTKKGTSKKVKASVVSEKISVNPSFYNGGYKTIEISPSESQKLVLFQKAVKKDGYWQRAYQIRDDTVYLYIQDNINSNALRSNLFIRGDSDISDKEIEKDLLEFKAAGKIPEEKVFYKEEINNIFEGTTTLYNSIKNMIENQKKEIYNSMTNLSIILFLSIILIYMYVEYFFYQYLKINNIKRTMGFGVFRSGFDALKIIYSAQIIGSLIFMIQNKNISLIIIGINLFFALIAAIQLIAIDKISLGKNQSEMLNEEN